MDVRTIFLLLLSGICVTVPFQNLTIMIVIWDQLVWRKRIKLLRCCSILLTRSTNWATAISTEYCSHCFPLLTSCAFPSSGGICWVPLQKFSECTAMNKSNCLLKPFFYFLLKLLLFFLSQISFCISTLFLEFEAVTSSWNLSPWLQSVLMPTPLGTA